jgi:phosphoribosylformylglycinamidine (FGAM) synthase-like enzyme
VYRQYDHDVRHGTVLRPGAADAAIVRVLAPGSGSLPPRAKAVAITAGCQSRHVYLAPYEGTRLVIAEAHANLVAVGATPLAVTDCLNFGNPERPEIMWQLAESIRGMADALRELDVPVVSGNVSLYNETDGKAIKPTPMIAMVGLLEDAGRHATMSFRQVGDIVAVVGDVAGDLAGSSYLEYVHGLVSGVPARLDVARHRPVFDAVLALVQGGHLASAHDISDGGLAVAVAECAVTAERPLGVSIDLPAHHEARADEVLFGEAPARFVISFASTAIDAVQAVCAAHGAPLHVVGSVGGPNIDIRINGQPRILLAPALAHAAWTQGFQVALG